MWDILVFDPKRDVRRSAMCRILNGIYIYLRDLKDVLAVKKEKNLAGRHPEGEAPEVL